MKKLFLAGVAWAALAALASPAQAQCIAVGGINNVPQPGMSCLNEPAIDSFAATSIGLATAASATDVACITGSATRVVRLQSIRVSGTSGTLVTTPIVIVKRATADTGGTPAATTALPVPYPLDSQDAAATATTIAYTANPTINDSAPGIIEAQTTSFNTTAALVSGPPASFDWASRNYVEAPTLRGVAQQICVNLNGITVATSLLNISFRWTELPQ